MPPRRLWKPSSNPWKNFTWIDGTEPKKRHLSDEELRQASNRTYCRLTAGLSLAVVERHGFNGDDEGCDLEERLKAAVAAKDWEQAKEILDRLSSQGQ